MRHRFEIISRAADGQREFARQVGFVVAGLQRDFFQGRRGGVVILVHGSRAEAFGHAFFFGGLFCFFLEPPEQPRVFFEKCAPNPCFRQDGPVGEPESGALERSNDGITHVGDKYGHGGHGDKRPDDEKRFPSIAAGAQVTVPDGKK